MPDRIVYQAWCWQLTTENEWIDNLTAAIKTIRAKRPSAKRIDLMTIIRSPQNGWCHTTTPPLRPPLGPGTDHEATLQDSHVPDYVDAAFAKVAAANPDLVSIAPKFEAHACAEHIDGIHLGQRKRGGRQGHRRLLQDGAVTGRPADLMFRRQPSTRSQGSAATPCAAREDQ